MSYGRGDLTSSGGFNDITSYNSYQNYGSSTSDTDFSRLMQVISANVDKISQYVQDIKHMVNQLGSDQDTAKLRDRLRQRQHYTNQLCKETANHLKSVKSLRASDSPSEQRHRKTQTKLLTDNFTDVLNSFQAAQRHAAATEKECVERARVASAAHQGKDVLVDLEGNLQDQEQSQITEDELQEIQEREDAIRQLEADIIDVNTIFKEIGTMVYDQGELVDSIEGNLDRAEDNVVQGNVQLSKARDSQASARKKKCICAAIIATVLIVIIIIIAATVPKTKK